MLNMDPVILPTSYEKVNDHSASHNNEINKSKTTEEMFYDISKSTLRVLRNIYSDDYLLFGYSMPDWLKNV